MAVALGARHERGDGVDGDHVHRVGAQERLGDLERLLTRVRLRDQELVGVNTDELLISQPDTGEQALEITETLLRSNSVDVIAIDSVAALVPRAERDRHTRDPLPGLQARLLSRSSRR